MRTDTLPSPGIGPRGCLLRSTAAQAISQVQIAAAYYPGGKHPDAVALSEFFEACRAAAATIAVGGGTPTPTPVVAPPTDWRMPATVAVSPGISGAQAALATAQANTAAKSRPSVLIAAGATEYIEWTVQQAGTILLSWLGQSDATTTVTKNGTAQTYAPQFPTGSSVTGVSGTGGRRQFVKVAVVAGDVLRMTVAAGASDKTVYPLLHKLPTSGPWDAHVVFGASREAQGLGCELLESALIADDTTRDPVIFSFAVSSTQIAAVASAAQQAAPVYAGAASYAFLGSIIGNDVSANRPYDTGEKAALDASIASIFASLAGFTVGFSNTSFRHYALSVAASAQVGGSREYNDAVIHPAILAYAPDCYDPQLKRARTDDYLAVLYNRSLLYADGIHDAYSASIACAVGSWFKRVKTGSWVGVTSQIERRVSAAEAAATNKATALSEYNEAVYAMVAIDSTAPAKPGFQARLNAVYPTALFYEAVRLIDVAAANATAANKTNAQTALDAASAAGYAGAVAPNTIAAQQARINNVVVLSFDQTVKVGWGATAPAVATWNRINQANLTGVVGSNLLDEAGADTGIGINMTKSASQSATQSGLVSSVAEVPDALLSAYAYDTSDNFTFQITGLVPGRAYDVMLMPSRASATVSSTKFSVQGVVYPDVPANNNVSQYALATNVIADASGNITVDAARGSGSSYVYLNAMILKRRM